MKIKKWRPFEEAKKEVHLQNFKNMKEFRKWKQRPPDIPSHPETAYKNEGWEDYPDFLGTKSWPFEKAREYVRKFGFKNNEEWRKWCKSGKKPDYIPSDPDKVYRNKGWNGWPDFLGYEGNWSIERVKILLRDLIKSKIIYQWKRDAVLYRFLITKGLLNLHDNNRHQQFFKNLIEARHTAEGRQAIEEYANSDSEIPPDLSQVEEEIGTASTQEIADLVENESTEPLDYNGIGTVRQIFDEAKELDSINVDEEAMQFFLISEIQKLWKKVFQNEENILDIQQEAKDGNKFHDTVLKTFLSEYEGTQHIEIPEGYSFRDEKT